jgi:hypothetical protein
MLPINDYRVWNIGFCWVLGKENARGRKWLKQSCEKVFWVCKETNNTRWAIQHFLEGVVQTNEKSLSENIKANSIDLTYTISAYYWCGVDLVSDKFIGSLQRQNDNKIKELEILAGKERSLPSLCDALQWPQGMLIHLFWHPTMTQRLLIPPFVMDALRWPSTATASI